MAIFFKCSAMSSYLKEGPAVKIFFSVALDLEMKKYTRKKQI